MRQALVMTSANRKPPAASRQQEGFSLIETLIASSVLLIALVALAGVLVTVSHQREQVSALNQFMFSAQNIMEEMKGIPPELVSTYDGKRFSVPKVTGANEDGTALSVQVDGLDPKLIEVTVNGEWTAAGTQERRVLRTAIYNP